MHWTNQISKAPSKCHKKNPKLLSIIKSHQKIYFIHHCVTNQTSKSSFFYHFFSEWSHAQQSLHPISARCLSTCPFKIIILIEISKRNIIPIRQHHKHISFNWSWFVYIIISQSWLRGVNAEITNPKIYHNSIFKGYYCSLNR